MHHKKSLSNRMKWIPDPPKVDPGMNTGLHLKPVSSIQAVPVYAIETDLT